MWALDGSSQHVGAARTRFFTCLLSLRLSVPKSTLSWREGVVNGSLRLRST